MKWTDTVVSIPDFAADAVAGAAVPAAGAADVAPDAPDAVAAGAVAAGVEEVVVQPATQASRMTSTAILMRAKDGFMRVIIYKIL